MEMEMFEIIDLYSAHLAYYENQEMEELEDEFNELLNEILTEWIKDAIASFFLFLYILKNIILFTTT